MRASGRGHRRWARLLGAALRKIPHKRLRVKLQPPSRSQGRVTRLRRATATHRGRRARSFPSWGGRRPAKRASQRARSREPRGGLGPLPPRTPRGDRRLRGPPPHTGRRCRPPLTSEHQQGRNVRGRSPKPPSALSPYQPLRFWAQTVYLLVLRGRGVGHPGRLRVHLARSHETYSVAAELWCPRAGAQHRRIASGGSRCRDASPRPAGTRPS